MYVNSVLEGQSTLRDEFGSNAPTHVDFGFMKNGKFILITDNVLRVYEDGELSGTKGTLQEMNIPYGVQAAFQMSDSDYTHGRVNLVKNYVMYEYKMSTQYLEEKGELLIP